MKSKLLKIAVIVPVVLYVGLLAAFYFGQDKLLFEAPKLASDFQYDYPETFEEINIETEDGIKLNTLLFKADSSKGVVLFFRGSGGTLDHWAKGIPSFYLENNYDFFLAEYRGYSKSEGVISSQDQFNSDMQTTYDFVKSKYPENKIIVMGYSLGSGPAAFIASNNNPNHLILLAPYTTYTELVVGVLKKVDTYPEKIANMLPISLLLRYEFNTVENLKNCSMPITVFHGDKDEVIPLEHAIRLKEDFKQEDRLFILKGQEHNGVPRNPELQKEMQAMLMNQI